MSILVQQGGLRSDMSDIRPPRTRAELDAMTLRRGELHSQLRTSEQRRFLLAEQSQSVQGEGRAAMTQRIATLDSRIAGLERQIQQLDDAISAGLANSGLFGGADAAPSLISPPGIPAPPIPPGPPLEPVIMVPPFPGMFPVDGRTMLAGGLVTLSLLALIVWAAVRVALRKVTRGVGAGAVDSSQINQLQQSVDAIAVEVERISENQRYVTRLLNEGAPGIAIANGDRPELQGARPANLRDK
jgi:hypothetical protein